MFFFRVQMHLVSIYANKTEFMCFKKEGASEISRPVYIPQQQYLIYWKWYQNTLIEGVDSYWLITDHKEI